MTYSTVGCRDLPLSAPAMEMMGQNIAPNRFYFFIKARQLFRRNR